MNKKTTLTVSLAILSALPVSVFAYDLATSSFKGVICYVISILNLVLPVLMAGALVFFFWGLSKFVIRSSGNEKELQAGKSYMLWGVLALFVLLSFRAITGILTNEFGFGNATDLPLLPGSFVGTGVCNGGGGENIDSSVNYDTGSTDLSGINRNLPGN